MSTRRWGWVRSCAISRASNRSDDTKSLGLKVGYKFRRWLTLGAEYWYTNRDSNNPGIDYDKNLYMLTATASM